MENPAQFWVEINNEASNWGALGVQGDHGRVQSLPVRVTDTLNPVGEDHRLRCAPHVRHQRAAQFRRCVALERLVQSAALNDARVGKGPGSPVTPLEGGAILGGGRQWFGHY